MEEKERTIPINVDVPEGLYLRLKEITKLSKRSLKKEALMAIERWVMGCSEDVIEPPRGQKPRDLPPEITKKNEDDLKHLPLTR